MVLFNFQTCKFDEFHPVHGRVSVTFAKMTLGLSSALRKWNALADKFYSELTDGLTCVLQKRIAETDLKDRHETKKRRLLRRES